MAFLSGRMIWEFEYRRSKMDKIYRRIRTVYTIANTVLHRWTKAIELLQAIGAAGTGYLRYGIFFAPHFVDLHAIFIPCMAGALTEKGLQRSEPPYRRARSSQGDPSQCRRRNPQHRHPRDLPNEGVEARECGLLA
jgi:hypothetical protein